MATIPQFVSLGMVVVDELRAPGREPVKDIPGGSGAFSVLGARLVAGADRAQSVGCFILAGKDFPAAVTAQFQKWNVNLSVKTDETRPSTRGLLEYHDVSFSRKSFRYTTTPLQPTPQDLPIAFLQASAFHLLAGPSYIEEQIPALVERRLRLSSADSGLDGASAPPDRNSRPRALVVWEPLPLQCSPTTKTAHLAACRHVDVFSPNHLELMSYFRGPVTESDAAQLDVPLLESYADAFLDAGIGPEGIGAIVVRAGADGCLVASRQLPGEKGKRHHWLPAWQSAGRSIVDATGAGNTFMGALTYAMAEGKDVVTAAGIANVAASFALEQIGLPLLESSVDVEKWNGSSLAEQYGSYEKSS